MFNTIPRSYFTSPSQTGPKIVSIPVHFIGSETKKTRSESALKIQKIFRGFLVRKNIKKILSIGREVNEVERKVLCNLEFIRKDSKERLRINETLMSLLFKLDSVQGVVPGVRDCRKAVIKKAIALQEKIDSSDDHANKTDGTLEMAENGDVIEMEKCDGHNELGTDVVQIVGEESGLDMECNDDVSRDSNKGSGIKDVIGVDCCDALGTNVAENASDNCMKSCDNASGNCNQGLEIEDVVNSGESGLQAAQLIPDGCAKQLDCGKCVDSDEDYCIVKQVVVGEEKDSDAKPIGGQVHEDDFGDDTMLKTRDDEAEKVSEERETDRELMERMMEENGKMMSMMKQLSEQNQAQTQMLSLLRQRVENLEKTFVREVSRKKTKDKKKRAANGITDGLDCCPDSKKCGRR